MAGGAFPGAACGGASCGGCLQSIEVGCGGTSACTEVDIGSLATVGRGRGDWVAETTYRYVGGGFGDLAVVTRRRNTWGLVVSLLVLVILAALAVFLLWPGSPKTTTARMDFATPPPSPRVGRCVFWGDPHILTFDGARPSFYGDGEFWIVKNDNVQIQGRYMGTPYTYGLAATQKVAVGGPFLKGHTIAVEPMEHAYGGHILVDGMPVLLTYGTYNVAGVATVTYNDQGELPDKAASVWQRHVVHMDLPLGIRLSVFRWGNYLDLELEMPQLPGGQDGSCGNFNGEVSDDTTQAIFERVGARIADSELLFKRQEEIVFTSEETHMLLTECQPKDLIAHELKCRKELPGTPTTAGVNSCVFDQCFGMNEHALRSAKTYATPEDRAAAHESSPQR